MKATEKLYGTEKLHATEKINAKVEIETIHTRAILTAKLFKRCEVELIEILEEVDRHRVYSHKGFNSLFKYATDALKLSEEVAYIFINVARKTREVPELKSAIKNGDLTVSKAKKITSVLTAKNHGHWLDLAKNSSKRELEKQVAASAPETTVRDLLNYVSAQDEVAEKVKIIAVDAPTGAGSTSGTQSSVGLTATCRVQLQVGVSEKLMLQIRHAQDVLSQKRQRSVGLEELLQAMTRLFLEKNDPLEKAKRHIIRGEKAGRRTSGVNRSAKLTVKKLTIGQDDFQQVPVENKGVLEAPVTKQQVPGPVTNQRSLGSSVANQRSSAQRRSPLPFHAKHKIWFTHQGRCSHVDEITSERCSQKRFLHIHHEHPVANGGTHELTNLTLLCAGHHRVQHLG